MSCLWQIRLQKYTHCKTDMILVKQRLVMFPFKYVQWSPWCLQIAIGLGLVRRNLAVTGEVILLNLGGGGWKNGHTITLWYQGFGVVSRTTSCLILYIRNLSCCLSIDLKTLTSQCEDHLCLCTASGTRERNQVRSYKLDDTPAAQPVICWLLSGSLCSCAAF